MGFGIFINQTFMCSTDLIDDDDEAALSTTSSSDEPQAKRTRLSSDTITSPTSVAPSGGLRPGRLTGIEILERIFPFQKR